MSPATAVLVDLVVAFGLVVILPLGLSLLGSRTVPGAGSAWWPAAGAVTAAGAWLPGGPLAQASTVPFLGGSAVLLVAAVRVLLGPTAPRRPEVRLAVGVALVMPGVGAAAMLADRGGWGLLGFSGTYLTLTVPHMLFAGFAAALVAGLTVTLDDPVDGPRGRPAAARLGAVGVPTGTAAVLVGYFVGNTVELLGALVLTAALWSTAWAVVGVPAGRGARMLLTAGSLAVGASMLLAVWWAVGELTGVPHPSIGQMAATHGVANALGFSLCTMLGLRLARVGADPGRRAPAMQEDDRTTHRPSRSPGRRQA
ncbi:YndJ family protein [Oerskovia paurometabola]|uniref:YndJ family protein n=1 Tax=Oerskovia paurometabola TaxID=162170 RepID=UPI0038156C93